MNCDGNLEKKLRKEKHAPINGYFGSVTSLLAIKNFNIVNLPGYSSERDCITTCSCQLNGNIHLFLNCMESFYSFAVQFSF